MRSLGELGAGDNGMQTSFMPSSLTAKCYLVKLMRLNKLENLFIILAILPSTIWIVGYVLNDYITYSGLWHDFYIEAGHQGCRDCSFWKFMQKNSNVDPVWSAFFPVLLWLILSGSCYLEIKIVQKLKSSKSLFQRLVLICIMALIATPLPFSFKLGSIFFPECYNDVRLWIIRRGPSKVIVEALMGKGEKYDPGYKTCLECTNFDEEVFYYLSGGSSFPADILGICYTNNKVCEVTRLGTGA